MKRLSWVLVLVLVVWTGVFFVNHRTVVAQTQSPIDGVILPKAKPIAQFHLEDQNGSPFTQDNLTGHWSMLFFGFTSCGMVCPTTLSELNTMYQALQKELPAQAVPQVIFVTVDPERDTTARIKSYLTAFNPHFIGARANLATISQLTAQFKIAVAKMQVTGEGQDHYTINHGAEILLINPQGQLQAYLSYPHKASQLIKDYETILQMQLG